MVAKPDDHWGETPCAFIALRPGAAATEREIIDWCRATLAHFKCPKTVIFRELPKTLDGQDPEVQAPRGGGRGVAPGGAGKGAAMAAGA